MRKIIFKLSMLFLIFNFGITYSYDIDEGATTIKSVITKLKGSDYSFKYNAGSSAKSSYHVFYKNNMIGYIYATDKGITLGEGWDSNGELGIFFNQKDLSIEKIVDRFFTDKSILGEVGLEEDKSIYLCAGDTEIFFKCLGNYTNKNKNSKGQVFLFDNKLKRKIDINFGDNILFKSTDDDGITKVCNIKKDNKLKLVEVLERWEEGAFSNKDFSFTECKDGYIGDKEGDDLGNVLGSINSNLDNNSFLDLPSLDGIDDSLGDFYNDIVGKVNNDSLLNLSSLDGIDSDLLKNQKNNLGLSYKEGLDIVNEVKNKLNEINKSIINEPLKDNMLLYRKMWNNTKNELSKNIEGKEGLKIKYLHASVELKYKDLFKEYVLSKKTNNSNINKDGVNINKDGVNINKGSNDVIPSSILKNFKNIFTLLSNKYNKPGNFTAFSKQKMEGFFDKVDKKDNFSSINDFLISDTSILDDTENIELLQKLLIIMCNK